MKNHQRRLLVPLFFDMNFNQKVEDLLTEALKENPHIFLVDLKIGADNSIKIILDGDEEINVKDCINISRAIEHELDRDEEDFGLEVASAGVGSPLKFSRQYLKNINRELEVMLLEGEIIIGKLVKVNEKEIELVWKQREPKRIGKGKVTVEKNKVIAFEQINHTKVVVKF